MPQPAASADQLDASSNDLVLSSSSLLDLPDELISRIFLMLAVAGNLQPISNVNRRLRGLANDDQVNQIAGLQIDAEELELFERYKTFSSLDELIALASQYQALMQEPSAASPQVQAAFAQLQQKFEREAPILKAHIAYLAHTADNHPDSFNLCSALDNLFSNGVPCGEITPQQFDIYYDLMCLASIYKSQFDARVRKLFISAITNCCKQNMAHPANCDWSGLNPILNSSRLRLNSLASEKIILTFLFDHYSKQSDTGNDVAALVVLDFLKFMEPFLEKNKEKNPFVLLLIQAAKALEEDNKRLDEFFQHIYKNFLLVMITETRVVEVSTEMRAKNYFAEDLELAVEQFCSRLGYVSLCCIIELLKELDDSELRKELSYYVLLSLKNLFDSEGLDVSSDSNKFWRLVFEFNSQDQTFIKTVFRDTLNTRFSPEASESFIVSMIKKQMKNLHVFFEFFPWLEDADPELRKKLIFDFISFNASKFIADQSCLTRLMSILLPAERKFSALLAHIICRAPLPQWHDEEEHKVELQDVCIYAILHHGAGSIDGYRGRFDVAANDRLLLAAARSKPDYISPVLIYGPRFFNLRSQEVLENAICAAAKQGFLELINHILKTEKIPDNTLRVVFKDLIIYCYRNPAKPDQQLMDFIDSLAAREGIEAGFIDRESKKEIKAMFVLARFRQKIREVEGFGSYEGSIATFRRECMAVKEVNDLCEFRCRLDNVVQPLNEHYRSRFSSVQSQVEAIIDEAIERARQLDNGADLLVASVACSLEIRP